MLAGGGIMGDEQARPIWIARGEPFGDGLHRVTGHLGDEHPDGAVVDDAEAAARRGLFTAGPTGAGMVCVRIAPQAIPGAPEVWFVEVPEPKASPAATNLVGFATDARANGTIVSRYAFATMGVDNADQVGAIRWYPATGLVHQVFVAEAWRRRQLATVLTYTAAALQRSRSLPGLHADGRRTTDGEQFAASLRHPSRIRPLDTTMPSMDPGVEG